MDINQAGQFLKIAGAWNTFKANHPKFPAFCRAASKKCLQEGSILEIRITMPGGETLETNLKVQQSDLELLREFGAMRSDGI